ncbi:MAG: hypothetical protein ISR85_01855 [Kiritimatiellales bacterium]|nr:hypothetical protein [Kiritimatiellota bacterium]MBL7011658.1 hypothetical protein [Kiritimatiellales bacterium]
MRIRRAMRKKPLRRPIKSPGARRYRVAQQKKRLAELGLTAEQIRKMNTQQIRAALQRPNKISA